MKTKEITLAGQQVTLGYCYATEISFKILSESDIQPFMIEAVQALGKNQMPDAKKTVCLILAAAMAYAESKDEKPVIDDKTLMYEAGPEEIGLALGTVIALWTEFYKMPAGEPKDKEDKKGNKRKN
jgi:hypothetical protein